MFDNVLSDEIQICAHEFLLGVPGRDGLQRHLRGGLRVHRHDAGGQLDGLLRGGGGRL